MLIYIFSLQRQLEAVVRKEYVNKHEDSVKCAFGPLQTSVPPAFPGFDNYNVSKQPKCERPLAVLIQTGTAKTGAAAGLEHFNHDLALTQLTGSHIKTIDRQGIRMRQRGAQCSGNDRQHVTPVHGFPYAPAPTKLGSPTIAGYLFNGGVVLKLSHIKPQSIVLKSIQIPPIQSSSSSRIKSA